MLLINWGKESMLDVSKKRQQRSSTQANDQPAINRSASSQIPVLPAVIPNSLSSEFTGGWYSSGNDTHSRRQKRGMNLLHG
jgi:hypothetical protein